MLSNHSYNNGNDSNNNNNASSNLNDNRGAIVGNAVSAAVATTAPVALEGSSTALSTVEDSAAALGLDLQQQQQHHLSPDPYNSLMAAAAAAAAAVRKSVKQEFLAGGDLVGDGTPSAVGN